MIIEADTPMVIAPILELAKKVKKMDLETLKDMLVAGMARHDSKVLIEKKNDKIRGFLYATIDVFNGEDVVFIQACYIEPESPQAGHEMLNKIRKWGADNSVKNIYFWSYRDPKGFMKKYQFDHAGWILKRGI